MTEQNPVDTAEVGATSTEYLVLFVLIALAIIVGANLMGVGLNTSYENACERIENEISVTFNDPSIDCEN